MDYKQYVITRESNGWAVWEQGKTPALSNHTTLDGAEMAQRRYELADQRRAS